MKAPKPASTPPCACSTQASVRPQKFAVKVMARLSPPERIGTSIASVRRPSSGSWKAIEPKFSPVRKRGVARLKAITTTTQEADQAEHLGPDQVAQFAVGVAHPALSLTAP